MKSNNDSFWRRILYKYRLSIMNEDTFTEIWHTRLSRMSVFVIMVLLFIFMLGLYSFLIFYTPIRNVLPGYSESIRQRLIDESKRVDSLGTELELQTRYLSVVRDVVAGEVKSDTVQRLDSMQIIMRERLLDAKSEATAEFMAEYEEKERDNLQLFDIRQAAPSITFFRPVHGVIVKNYDAENREYGVEIQTPKNENVTSVLAGTIIHVDYDLNNTYCIFVQHQTYLSIYGNVAKVLKRVGDAVQAGESIGLMSEEHPLYFELWQSGKNINPEEVIVF
ncbi:MAG: M23 family metallopeptidase [Paludibacteraceae bacterium]|nr:M23 family metallopeptidase [Paludibacteraceae bacterium]